ncbi:MAG: TetR/AcrR family transcriptional regulator [Propionibacteriaceae bacterium]|jgi:AcrR family transcriptional regulator|nr:TetR/AcrR family transcriptional regulator [Propionibacteriaceae bacterium]
MARASAQPPQERRRSIIAATIPLLIEHGLDISTRAIATAAGVAEGTIFRYFETKRDLLREAVQTVMEPSQLVSQVEAIDPDQPLPQRIDCLVELLMGSSRRMRSLMMVLHTPQARFEFGPEGKFGPAGKFGHGPGPGPGEDRCVPGEGPGPCSKRGPWSGHRIDFDRRGQDLLEAIVAVLAPDRERLTVDLELAAAYIRLLTLATAMAPLGHPRLLDAANINRLVLGALLNPDPTRDAETAPDRDRRLGSDTMKDHQ